MNLNAAHNERVNLCAPYGVLEEQIKGAPRKLPRGDDFKWRA